MARKSIQSQEGTEGCLTKPKVKAVVSSCGTRIGSVGTLYRALGPAKENNYPLESPKAHIVLALVARREIPVKIVPAQIVFG